MTRTAELTAKLLDGTLSEAELTELESLIANDPVAEAEHISLLELEVELRALRTDLDLADAAVAKVETEKARRTAEAVLNQITSAPPPAWAPRAPEPKSAEPAPARLNNEPSASARSRRIWVGGLALAACAAAVLIAMLLSGQNSQLPSPDDGNPAPAAFAKLAHKAGSVELLTPSGETIPAIEGRDLPAGFTVRTVGDDSMAVVELLNDKMRVEIEPDSIVRFAGGTADSVGKPRVFLAAGQLTAAVPQRPEDQPMIVGTSMAEVFTREGTFVLSTAAPDSVRVDIKHGKVDVVRTTTPKPVRLDAGRAAVFAGVDQLDIEHAHAVDHTPKRSLSFPGARDVAFSPDGSEVWVVNARAFTRWPANGSPTELSFYPPRKVNEGVAAITRNKKYLVAFRGVERDDRVLVRTLPDGGEHAALNARLNDPRLWTVAPNASWLAAVDPRPNNKRVRVLDGARGDERFVREFDESANIPCIASAPSSKYLAVGVQTNTRGAGNKVVIVDAFTSDHAAELPFPKRPLMALSFSPDSRILAAGFNGTVQLWDWQRGSLFRSINGFERALVCLAFSPDGKRLAAATQDGHVWLWNVDTGRQTQLIDVGSRGIRAVAFSPNGKQLVTLTNPASVAVWDVADRTLPLPNLQ